MEGWSQNFHSWWQTRHLLRFALQCGGQGHAGIAPEERNKKRTMFLLRRGDVHRSLEAVLLKQLVFMTRPQRVLEVGMFVGYGAAAMLEGSPTTQVVSLEIDPLLGDLAVILLEVRRL